MLLKNETFLFSEFIAGVNNIIYPQVRSKGLDYECTVSGDVDDSYVGDEMKLQQILVNVLGNAVKFTEKGKVTLDVSVSARTGNRVKLRFVVGDTGCGIAEEDLGRIFDALSRGSSTTSVFVGTGCLAITKKLAGLMRRRTARSIEGVGSEFSGQPPDNGRDGGQPAELPINLRDLKTLIVDTT
jgi:signal transduction histidine kinase